MRRRSSSARARRAGWTEMDARLVGQEAADELLEPTGLDGLADLAHQLLVVVQVVDGVEPGTQDLAALVEVAQVGAGIVATGVAAAGLVDGAGVVGIAGIADAQQAVPGVEKAGAGVARGNDAVEHVHPAAHGLDDVLRLADAHQVARPVGGQQGGGGLEDVVAFLHRFAHRQPADGIAVETDLEQALGRFAAQAGIHAALDDAEQGRRVVAMGRLRAPRPAQRQRHRFARLGLGSRIGRALVEDHDDVGAQRALHGHGAFRRQLHQAAVHRRAEAHTLLADLAHLRQAVDLEAAGIGEDRAFPVHEAMQVAMPADDVGAGPQHQVEGVAEDDLGAQVFQLLRRHGLDRAVGADRHEGRGLHRAAGETQPAAARRAVAGEQFKLHHGVRSTWRPRS